MSLLHPLPPTETIDHDPGPAEPPTVTDAELVGRFVRQRDETAFAELVGRFGTLVYAVALRVLKDRHAAEDVFQATFFVLARDAAKLRRRESVASWLHGVALRLAKKSLVRRHRMPGSHQVEELDVPAADPLDDIQTAFDQQVLDEELQKLPDQYREALVLHFLEEKTYEETARALGVTMGVIEGRLKRGKRELQLRLARRGVGLGIAVAAIAWSQSTAQATISTNLLTATLEGGLASCHGTPFTSNCSSEAVHLAARETAMLTTGKVTLATCGLLIAAAAGWWGSPGAAQDAPGLSGGGVDTSISDQLDPDAGEGLAFQHLARPAGDEPAESGAPGFRVRLHDARQLPPEARQAFLGTLVETLGPRVAYNGEYYRSEPALIHIFTVEENYLVRADERTQEQVAELLRQFVEPFTSGDSTALPDEFRIRRGSGRSADANIPAKITVSTDLHPNEEEILAVLDNVVKLDFPGNPLSDVIDFISNQHNIPIRLDEAALMENGIDRTEEIHLVLSGVTLRSALNLMLKNVGGVPLTYVIENEVLTITTQDAADEILETRVYDVRPLFAAGQTGRQEAKADDEYDMGTGLSGSDIMMGMGPMIGRGDSRMSSGGGGIGSSPLAPMAGRGMGGAVATRSATPDDPRALVDVIKHGTSGQWEDEHGTGGEISYFRGSFVIRQTQAVHAEIEKLLNNLAKQLQAAEQSPSWSPPERPVPPKKQEEGGPPDAGTTVPGTGGGFGGGGFF